MTTTGQQIAVIGGGLGGLASACTLAARGHSVVLFERNEWLGGKAALLEGGGFRFDMGPTILTLPSVLRRIFAEAGRSLGDYLELIQLDPQWRCFFEGGDRFDLVADASDMHGRISQFAGRIAADGYVNFLHTSKRLHRLAERFFFWKNVGNLRDALSGATVSQSLVSDVLQIRMGRTVAGLVRSCIPDERVAQMADHFTQYVGSAPGASPAVLCGIAHMQTHEGVWYPIGGTRAIPNALAKLAGELGVVIRAGVEVSRIVVENGAAAGVELASGEFVPAVAIVSNCDSLRTHRELLDTNIAKRFQRRRSYEPACSGVVLYLGLKRRYEQLLHHNFVFSSDPHDEFEHIYRRGRPAPDPTCYICAPAVTEPGVAPAGGEALYVLVHTPFLRPGHDWRRLFPGYRRIILDKLQRAAGLDGLEQNIVFESKLTPNDIHTRYRVLNGAIYGLASHGRFLGAFKPPNRSADVNGLYFSGGSAHPGPGMPMVVMSGWIAADTLHADFRARNDAAMRKAAQTPVAT